MAVTLILHGDGTATVTLGRTASVEKIEATGNAAAHRLYNTGRYVPVNGEGVAIPWDDLTNMQKLGMLDEFAFDGIHEEAMAYLHGVRQTDAAAYRAADAATVL